MFREIINIFLCSLLLFSTYLKLHSTFLGSLFNINIIFLLSFNEMKSQEVTHFHRIYTRSINSISLTFTDLIFLKIANDIIPLKNWGIIFIVSRFFSCVTNKKERFRIKLYKNGQLCYFSKVHAVKEQIFRNYIQY